MRFNSNIADIIFNVVPIDNIFDNIINNIFNKYKYKILSDLKILLHVM
jgi:hypothetical protein